MNKSLSILMAAAATLTIVGCQKEELTPTPAEEPLNIINIGC